MKKIILIAILLVLFTSCSAEKTKNTEIAQTSGQESIDTIDSEDFTQTTVHQLIHPILGFSFEMEDIVIVEWGDVVDLNIYDDGTGVANKYKGVGVKYIKEFESTSFGPGNSKLNCPELRYSFIDEDIREKFISDHDDILLIPTECTDIIVKGESILTYIHRFFTYDIQLLPMDSHTYVGFFIISSLYPGTTEIISMVDGKVQLDNGFYDGKSALGNALIRCNEKLTQLGLTDNLFRDGMTIDELEEYFNLVTDENTFAPLFEKGSDSITQ